MLKVRIDAVQKNRRKTMKKRLLITVIAVILVASAMSMAACTSKNVYENLGDEGYSVRVRFDACGGVVNETQNVTIVEVLSFNESVTLNGKTGVKLLDPADPVRGEGVFKVAKSDEKYYYFQAGWYRERSLRTDEQGRALDSFGELVSESGREQGYVYGGLWDFNNDVVTESDLVDGEITLYAAWIPFFNYEFYSLNASGEYECIGSTQKLTLTYPKWNDRKEQYDMKDFPKMSDKVFAGAYLDEDMTVEITGNFDGRESFVDYENGIVENSTVKIYVAWTDAAAE